MHEKGSKLVFGFLCSFGLTVCAFMVMPTVIKYASKFFDRTVHSIEEDDDWGPEIVRREEK